VRYVDALLCVVLLLVCEGIVVGLVGRGALVGLHELGWALTTLVPLAIAAATPIVVGAAFCAWGLEGRADPRRRLFLLGPLTVLAAGVGATTARPVVAVVLAASAAALAWWGAEPAGRGLERLGSGARAAVFLGAALALELVTRWLIDDPAPRLGLAIVTVWTAGLAGLSLSRADHARLRGAAAALVLGGAWALAVYAPERLRGYDNVRAVYGAGAPLLSQALRLATWLSPPVVERQPEPAGPALELAGRDVLLVTIDSLRADHVGAYGYERGVTPALDALARDGAVFTAAYSPTPQGAYAITSLMTAKYMRPLLLQGLGEGSETWAEALRRYGYRTAAFHSPSLFALDRERFAAFEERGLGFEERVVEPATAAARAARVSELLRAAGDRPLFLWVHLDEPHEPYEAHADHDFGDRAIDRYDAEIAAADEALGTIVHAFRAARPRALVVVTADHGEEFGERGGRGHGATVYDEQVRVPLVLHAPGLVAARRIHVPVSLVDVAPTVLAGVGIPASPRQRGRDLGPLMHGLGVDADRVVYAESDDQALLAAGDLRLVCPRGQDACRLFDVAADPGQKGDASALHMRAFVDMKEQLASFAASLGRFEAADAEWPRALRRGLAGDVEAAADVAALLDDVDVRIRRKAAEVLFELGREEGSEALRRALRRDDDELVRRWCALALTRLGQGAPLALDLVEDRDLGWRRLAALALAEAGDARGEGVLLAWWRAAYPEEDERATETIPARRARAVARAFARIKSEAAVAPLTRALADVRLRPYLAEALAGIGHAAARPSLAKALATERSHDARAALAEAIVDLGGSGELIEPLARFMGVPEPIATPLDLATRAKVLPFVGGPRKSQLRQLRRFATSGVVVGMVVPESDHAVGGLRVFVRARSTGSGEGEVRFGLGRRAAYEVDDPNHDVPGEAPEIVPELAVTLRFPAGGQLEERFADLPAEVAERVEPGTYGAFVVYATQSTEVSSCAVVPLARELEALPSD
jgi:arylsulfatase A-like enzyme